MSVHADAGVGMTAVPAAVLNQRHRGAHRPSRSVWQLASLPVTRELAFPTVLSVLVAGLLAVTSVVGLVWGQQGLYRADPTTLPAFLGQDALTLLVGLPLLIGAAWSTRRGSVRGLLVWLGALFYITYSYAYYVLSPEFNLLYPAYLTIVSASLYCLVYLLLSIDKAVVKSRFARGTPTRLTGGFMMVMALLLAIKWVTSMMSALSGDEMLVTHKNLVVWAMDLVVALPALFWGGMWLWRRDALGFVVAGMLLLKAAFVGITLVVDTWVMTLWGEASDPMLPAYAFIGVGGLVLLAAYLRCVGPSPTLMARTTEDASRPAAVQVGFEETIR
jgi:hypothetical protein